MKNCTITYEDIAGVYDELGLSSHRMDATKLNTSYEQITNRNFGVKDNTTSANFSESTDCFYIIRLSDK